MLKAIEGKYQMKKKTKKKLGSKVSIFNKVKDIAYVDVYGNGKYSTIDITWSLKNIGFGHLTIAYNKVSKELTSDTECMNSELITKILIMAAPKLAKTLIELDGNRK